MLLKMQLAIIILITIFISCVAIIKYYMALTKIHRILPSYLFYARFQIPLESSWN